MHCQVQIIMEQGIAIELRVGVVWRHYKAKAVPGYIGVTTVTRNRQQKEG